MITTRWLVIMAAVAAACLFLVLKPRWVSRRRRLLSGGRENGRHVPGPLPAAAGQARLTGRITGYGCYSTGTGCPRDRDDPIVEMERDFVLVTAEDSYYLLPNVERSAKLGLVTREVTVYGVLDPKYRSMRVERIEAGGTVVWLGAESTADGRGATVDRAWDAAVREQRGGRPNAPESTTDPTLKNLYGGH